MENNATDFVLNQNYPNPFNPSTKIKYTLVKDSFVSLKVYDILGKEVVSLVNEYKPAGLYSVTFDASKGYNNRMLSAGMYLFRITAGNQSVTKKMLLVK